LLQSGIHHPADGFRLIEKATQSNRELFENIQEVDLMHPQGGAGRRGLAVFIDRSSYLGVVLSEPKDAAIW
jgi:hypothetical protein